MKNNCKRHLKKVDVRRQWKKTAKLNNIFLTTMKNINIFTVTFRNACPWHVFVPYVIQV
jgi:hypothetical protein